MADEIDALLRHAEHVMGTVVSFAVRTEGRTREAESAVAAAVTWLHAVDERFSPYRPDSEVSRIAAGTRLLADASEDLHEVLRLCEEVSRATDGYFTVTPWGTFDPSGLVKGWAVERAADLLLAHGFEHHTVAGGGDVQVSGRRGLARPWTVGVADPHEPGAIMATLALDGGAVATSGTAERGDHVVDPHTGRAAAGLVSVTLVGSRLTFVDAYATAALAMGRGALPWVERRDDLEALVVDVHGTVTWSDGWPGTRPS